MNGGVDGQIEEYMDGWMEEWVGRRTEKQVHRDNSNLMNVWIWGKMNE